MHARYLLIHPKGASMAGSSLAVIGNSLRINRATKRDRSRGAGSNRVTAQRDT